MLPSEFSPYLFGDGGLVSTKLGEKTQNPIRSTSEAYIITLPLQHPPYGLSAHANAYSSAINSLMAGSLGTVLLHKFPGNDTDQVTVDDMVPLAHASKALYPDLFLSLCWHMWNHCGWYKNTMQDRGWGAFLWRHVAIIPIFRHKDLGTFRNLILSLFLPVSYLQVALTGLFDRKTQDGHILSWHLERAIGGWVMEFCGLVRERRMFKAYPGGYKELLTSYFGHEHPIATYWPTQ